MDLNNIKNKVRPEGQLPNEFSWENMEKGINEKINHTPPSKSNINHINVLLLAISILSIGLAVYYKSISKDVVLSNNSTVVNNHDVIKNDRTIEEKVSQINSQNITQFNNSNSQKLSTSPSHIISKETVSPIKSSNINNNNVAQFVQNKETKNSITSTNHLNNKEFNSSANNLSNFENTNLINNTSNSDKSEFSSELPLVKNEIIALIPTLKTPNYKSLNSVVDSKIKSFYFNPPIAPIIVKCCGKRDLIYFATGTTMSGFSYLNDSIGSLRKNHLKGSVGYFVNLGVEKNLGRNFNLNLGLNYNELSQILEYEKTLPYEEYSNNTLLYKEINYISKDTTSVYGPGLITGTKYRRVIHHNSFRRLSIPIIFAYAIHQNNWSYSFGLGPVLSYNISSNGRMIHGEDHFAPITNSFTNKINLDASFSGFIGRRISERTSLGFRISGFAPISNWSERKDVTMRNLQTGLVIGYEF